MAEHLGVVELDALVDFALLERGQDQADHAEAILLAGAHRGLHVIGNAGLERTSCTSWAVGWMVAANPVRDPGSAARSESPQTQTAGAAWAVPAERFSPDVAAPARCRNHYRSVARIATAIAQPLDQYMRWRLVTSRETRRRWRLTAAARLRLRSWVGFS